MKRIIVDYNKLNTDILNLLIERFPDGYGDKDIISFRNAHNDLIEAVEVKTDDTIYLVKVGTHLAKAMIEFADDDNEADEGAPVENLDDGDITN
ncbi:hypothetical protein [Seonamhaeicola maritimus]|uniref:DNA primase n=1 Tax=Seonamhaeicola maritimus TaxID=2591822 RepID=A0A5C7GGX1_9FLAO|nr:hypothetical protein [Seonamhaeicola maritimus]TXG36629.1 hypothetical protein FUA22_08565 [Seonamhaeicola maritimus]